jgi:hypothetical protein
MIEKIKIKIEKITADVPATRGAGTGFAGV